MKVKLLKSVIVNSVSNTEATRRDSVVEVDDAEGRDLIAQGYAEASSGKVTAQPRKEASAPDNKMAPDAANKATPNAVTGPGTRTVDTGSAPASRRGATAGAGRGGKRGGASKR